MGVWHTYSTRQTLSELETDKSRGLSGAEAERRLARWGPNRLEEGRRQGLLLRFLGQMKDPMILVLLAAAALSLWASGGEDWLDAAIILVIVVVNACISISQEDSAEKALEALRKMSAPLAKVVRDGALQRLETDRLVPGDIIHLEAGDLVPADARILEAASLQADESAMTGESVPVSKGLLSALPEDTPLAERHNMVLASTVITRGRAVCVVTGTGMDTEVGRIAGLLLGEGEGQTPLQKKMAEISKTLSFVCLCVCAVMFGVGLLQGRPMLDMFLTAVSLAVAAIPEGLPAIVTIVLALGVARMARRRAIVKRLPAVETLGCAGVICSDKTGTLTQNRMTLTHAYVDGGAGTEAISDNNSAPVRRLLQYAALCCDGSVDFSPEGEKHMGDPTETAIIVAAHRNGMEKDALNAQSPRLADLPFDSDRKLMTTVNRIDGRIVAIVKGAFDVMDGLCIAGDLAAARRVNDEMSRQALRVLAVGYKVLDGEPKAVTSEALENNLTFLGLVGMIDPPRPEAREAVKQCRRAGIKPVMITGDHVVTASAIAKDLGILGEGDEAVTGAELARMSEQDLDARVANISVYARVSPEDKIRIVQAWQRKGQIVAMTGDGVNDAPALKAADIGCAMGITGTDVAKGAADMTLTDDNFATIVDAVKEGRGIYDNIKKAVGFLLGTNIGEILTVFFAMIFWRQTPLLSMQLLWINLVTDSLPAIAIGMEPVESNVMDRKPKPKDESIFANGMGVRIGLQGILFAGLTLFGFWLGQRVTGDLVGGQTLAFMILALSQVFHAFNMRSNMSLFKVGVFSNRNMNKAALVSLVLMAIVLFVPPVASVFGLTQLPAWLYLVGLGCSLVSIPILEFTKAMGWHKA